MSDAIRETIEEAFTEFVEEPNKLCDKLLELAQTHNFDTKKVNAEFRKFMRSAGAEGDDLNEIAKTARTMMSDQVVPNRSTLFPDSSSSAEDSSKKKIKLGASKKSTASSSSTSAAASSPSDEAGSEDADEEDGEEGSKRRGRSKKDKDPKRQRGYDIYFNENKDSLRAEYEADWKKKHKNEDYVHNPTAVSKELGRRWREDLTEEERQDFRTRAEQINEENGVPQRSRKQVSEEDKKPLTPYQMYAKMVYPEMSERYREENELGPEDKVKPTEVMTLTAASWADVKKDEAQFNMYKTKAEEYNKEHGREARPKEKEKKTPTTKTNAYREFCQWFRTDFRESHDDHNPYEEAQSMNKTWNEEIKPDDKKRAHWEEVAQEENVRRGFEATSS